MPNPVLITVNTNVSEIRIDGELKVDLYVTPLEMAQLVTDGVLHGEQLTYIQGEDRIRLVDQPSNQWAFARLNQMRGK